MDDSLETFVPLTFRRRGSRRVAADDRDVHDVTLLEGIARGFYWQHLVDTGMAWRLQGWFGRTARDLIDQGLIEVAA